MYCCFWYRLTKYVDKYDMFFNRWQIPNLSSIIRYWSQSMNLLFDRYHALQLAELYSMSLNICFIIHLSTDPRPWLWALYLRTNASVLSLVAPLHSQPFLVVRPLTYPLYNFIQDFLFNTTVYTSRKLGNICILVHTQGVCAILEQPADYLSIQCFTLSKQLSAILVNWKSHFSSI